MRKSFPSRRPLIESLESRRMMSAATLNTNLIVNGDAEADTGASDSSIVTPTGWQSSTIGGQAPFSAVKYGTTGFPDLAAPGPVDRGNNFFAGGPAADEVSAFQDIDVSAQSIGIDAGLIKANLAGWLGGFRSEGDNAALGMQFLNKDNVPIGSSVFAGNVTAMDRGNVTEFLQRSADSAVPVGTRSIRVFLDCFRTVGIYNDGYADDLSLKLISTAKTGYVTAKAFVDTNENGTRDAGEKALSGVTVFVDKNSNFVLDKGELSAKTNKSGNVTISNVPRGLQTVAELIPKGYRNTTNPSLGTAVSGGETVGPAPFGLTQTAILNGRVFLDSNGDTFLNGKDKDIANVIVYLDFNNNGQLDDFELKTTSLPGTTEGNYIFRVPFGTYVIRIQAPKGYKLTGKAASPVTVTRGELTSTDIGIKNA